MIKRMAEAARPFLEFPIVRRTRRNHALEHATIHVLTERGLRASVAGRSSDGGFILIGKIPTEQVESAVREALHRLGRGETRLAVHPNCGTNLVTAGVLTTMVGWLGLGTTNNRPSLDRTSWTLAAMVAALIAAQPLGMSLQKHFTTKGQPGDLEVVGIARHDVEWPLKMTVHRVVTRRG